MTTQKENQIPPKLKKSYHIGLILVMILAVLLVVFAVQNSQQVVINLLFWKFSTSMALALVICIVSAFLMSFFYFLMLIHKKNMIIRARDKEIMGLKEKNRSLEYLNRER